MKAVIIKERGVAALADVKEPSMRPDYIKVRTIALAVNPTDLHHTALAGRIGGTIGCDLSGIVEEVGEECKSNVKKGDKVYGVCHGANLSMEEDGAFGEYAMVRDGHIAKIPEGLTFEETATLGVGITATGQGLYMVMGIPLPGEKQIEDPPFILVYGGSSATGTLAIQFAKLSGLTVVTTASPENFDLVKSRGADIVFDYHDPDCARKIKDYTKDSLHYVLDCVSTEASYKLIVEALPEKSEKPIQVVTLLPADTWPRKDVEPTVILAYTTLGKAFTKFGIDFPAMTSHFDFGVKFWKLSSELLASGQIKTHPIALRDGGLGGIPNGLAEHANSQVKAVKLVYRVSDTNHIVSGDDTAANAPKLDSSLKKW
ncbi:GroES-like protein [Pleomassaria siparia CBS 279.74]|uniref:GroES-like protein n=1 Tax=Pleomassaria siparia CBS 279.74 TaxID=1314801 RepID=A0A6G1JVW6_9PLEO|nr:GroES-like protein [Pleomassaria siparia CBS 279.74]